MKPKPKSWGGVWGFGYIQGYLQSGLRHFAAGSMVLPVYNLHERFENPMRYVFSCFKMVFGECIYLKG